MTALWQSLDVNQQAVLTCALTCLVGLLLGAVAVTIHERRNRRRIRTAERRIVTDDLGVQEYADATIPASGGSKYAGPDGLRRLEQMVAASNNPQSADFYLDKILDHPEYIDRRDGVA